MLTFALIGYAVLLGGVLLWEALGLRSAGDAWPTITELVRSLSAPFRSFIVGLCGWMAVHFIDVGEGSAIACGLGLGAATYFWLSRSE